MAFEYQNFATLSINLNRQKYGPLDISNVFSTQADLDYYLSKGAITEGVSEYWYKDANNKIVPYPYEGQVITTVIGGVVKVYVLALDSEGNFTTQNVGDTTAVEAAIADLETELREYIGDIPSTSTATNIVEYIDSKTEGIATSDSLAQLQRDVDALEEDIHGVEGIESKVDANAQAIADEAAARREAIGVASSPASGEPDTDGYIPAVEATGVYKAIEDSLSEAKKYTDDNKYDDYDIKTDVSILKSQVEALGSATNFIGAFTTSEYLHSDMVDANSYSVGDIIVIIHDDAEGADNSLSGKEYLNIRVNEDTQGWAELGDTTAEMQRLTEVETILGTSDTTGLRGRVSTLEAGKDAYVDADTQVLSDAKDYTDESLKSYDTKDEVTGKISTALESYTTTEELTTLLDGKVDDSTLADYYTKSDIDGKNFAVASEVDSIYATKQQTASDIATALEDYSTTDEVTTAINNKFAEVPAQFITTVDAELLVEEKKLSIVEVAQEKVTGLKKLTYTTGADGSVTETQTDATLSEILIPASFDSETGAGQAGLMTPVDKEKLSKLVLNSDGSVEVSAEVSADNVKGLSTYLNAKIDKIVLPTGEVTLTTNGTGLGQIISANIEYATTTTAGVIKSAAMDTENKVYVDEDGIGNVSKVNVNTLVQTTGDVIIFNGGNA